MNGVFAAIGVLLDGFVVFFNRLVAVCAQQAINTIPDPVVVHIGERKEEIVLSTTSGNRAILELNLNAIFVHQL